MKNDAGRSATRSFARYDVPRWIQLLKTDPAPGFDGHTSRPVKLENGRDCDYFVFKRLCHVDGVERARNAHKLARTAAAVFTTADAENRI